MTTKKSGSGWEEAERWGPYQIHEQVEQSANETGGLFRATHESTGVTALVLKPSTREEGDVTPMSDWTVRCVSSREPGYLAMEVERSPWSFAPDKHSSEEMVFLFERVRDGFKRMARYIPSPDEARPHRRLVWGLACVAAVCVLAFGLFSLVKGASPLEGPAAVAEAEAVPESIAVPTDIASPLLERYSLIGAADGGVTGLFRPVPSQPLKAQRRPPCIPRVEVELMGGCWVPHKLKAPCPEELYEHQGECYTASHTAQPQPRALGQ